MGSATCRTKNELQQLQQEKNNSTNEMELLNVQNARHTLFSAYLSNSVQNVGVIAVWLISKWRPPPSCIFAVCEFWRSVLRTPFSASVSNSVQMRASNIMAELWPKMWFSIWRPPPSWILSDTSSEGKIYKGTLLVSVLNLVPIRSKMAEAELWPFNWVQNGDRRHLEFTSGVYFYHLVVFG